MLAVALLLALVQARWAPLRNADLDVVSHLFDINDFDETLPGPFEYDVKRLVAICAIAGATNNFAETDTRALTIACVAAYRVAMAEFAAMRTMDVSYLRLSEEDLLTAMHTDAQQVKQNRTDRPAGLNGARRVRRGQKLGSSRPTLTALRHKP